MSGFSKAWLAHIGFSSFRFVFKICIGWHKTDTEKKVILILLCILILLFQKVLFVALLVVPIMVITWDLYKIVPAYFFLLCHLSLNTDIARSHNRKSGDVGIPGCFFTPFVDFATNWERGSCFGATGALPTPGFGVLWLFAACNSKTQRPGASQKSHRAAITNVNCTTYQAKNKNSCTQIHQLTANCWMWTAELLIY